MIDEAQKLLAKLLRSLTRGELAKLVEVHESTLANYQLGKVRFPRRETLARLRDLASRLDGRRAAA